MSGVPTPAATAERAVAGALVRHGLTIAGGYFAHRGWIDQDTASSAVAPIAEQIVGFVVAGGAAGWGALRARATHWRWVEALYAPAPARPLPPA
ncbi:hypothetical protein [Sphingomonas sp. CROZ-RG-20F-R02-07]|uniref:Pam3-gp28 family putative phage holin n=1 Tax=Sphingomonas sp. CROZ-RG-20F-R02-07 TaxID=2914832 RepID=UPI001F55E86D|nr:hypothetical protein [Sphingomonas sp. CROZ-RG-20F-R02-07]